MSAEFDEYYKENVRERHLLSLTTTTTDLKGTMFDSSQTS